MYPTRVSVGNGPAHHASLARPGAAVQKRIEAKLCDYVYPILHQNPYFGPNINRLKNWEPSTWRYRVGEWQFFYEVDDEEGIVLHGCRRPRQASLPLEVAKRRASSADLFCRSAPLSPGRREKPQGI
jgi:mRNA-degrading endonuclease RelE of RelBE toxin-antitoxin system